MGIIDQQAWISIEFTCAFFADKPKVRNIHQKQATPGGPKLAQADPESVPRRYQLIPDATKSSLCWYKMEHFGNMQEKFKNLHTTRHTENVKHCSKMGLMAEDRENPWKSNVLNY